MSDLPSSDSPYGPYLQEIAAMSVSLARNLCARAEETEDNDEACRLATAFHRVARGLRQTLALHAKLEQDAARAEREAQPERDRRHKARVAERHTKLHRVMQKTIWDEAESPEHVDDLIGELFEVLKDESEAFDFLDEPIETQIDRVRLAIGLDVADEDAVAEACTPEAMAKAELPPLVGWIDPPAHLRPNSS